jgi:lipopolysaccharide transport system ATP-binding protein
MAYAIKADEVGKRYLIRSNDVAYRDKTVLNEVVAWAKGFGHVREPLQEFWALRDISFTVNEGDKLGIIGKNGAGKSTLLKLLSRITELTTGTIRLRGRVASLLEVGTGFNPELTGRENIFLNGVILGMTRNEIRRKFDEIVEFAGIIKFLDTPVKRYSSGMYMRLAFSVAAHLDPEILIIDEVLAVGDADFQKKCLGKIEDINQSGRTVIFVSHSMATVASLCNKCILLEAGSIKKEGTPSEVILDYLGNANGSDGRVNFFSAGKPIGDDLVTLLYCEVFNHEGLPSIEVDICKSVSIRMGFRVLHSTSVRYIPNFHFVVPGGIYAFVTAPDTCNALSPGDYEAVCRIPGDFLNEGIYSVGLAISSYEPGLKIHFFEQSAITFNVKDSMIESVGRQFGYANAIPGIVRPRLPWAVNKI